MIGIYKITNLINQKIYIGQSKNIEDRWRAHRSRPFQSNAAQYESPLYKAIRKYGLKNFSFQVIEECTIKELNQKEIYWIAYYHSNDKKYGYNLTEGGQTQTFHKLSEKEVKEIQSLLIETNLSQQEIAEQYNINQRSISYINTGETWLNPQLNYPLRKINITPKQKEDNIRKEKKIYQCKDCGQIISTKAERCVKCAAKFARKTERPSRNELKNLIRTKSFLEIARIYNVSDNAIRKWCKAENLPYQKTKIKLISDDDWEKI